MRPYTLSCVAALVLACGAAGAAPPPPVLHHDALVARADAVCDRYAGLLQRPTGRTGTFGERAHDAAWLRLFAAQRQALAALRPSRRDARPYGHFLGSLPVVQSAARSLMRQLERNGEDRAARRALRLFLLAHSTSKRLARVVGLRRCPAA